MAKPTGFNFTFGTPSTPIQSQQPQQQQQQLPSAAAGQLQVPSFNFGQQTATKPVAPVGISFGTGATSSAPAISFGAGLTTAPVVPAGGAGISLAVGAQAAAPTTTAAAAAPSTGAPTQLVFGFQASAVPTPAALATQSANPVLGQTLNPSTTTGLTLLGATAANAPTVTTTTTVSASPFTLTAPTATTSLNLAQPAPVTTTPAATLTSTTTSSAAPTLTTSAVATTTVGGTTVGPRTAMKFGELEQLVASRRAELEQAGRAFIQLAAVLANRDAELRRSAVKLVGAEAELDRLRMTAETLDRELDYADTQTTELEGVVDDIERQLMGVGGAGDAVRQPLSASSIGTGACGDRSSTLQMAVAVDAQLRASARQLRSLSERVNSINGAAAMTGLNQRGDSAVGAAGASSGMATLTRLLDSQLRLLEWAESTSSQLQRRIDVLSNRVGGNSSTSAVGLSQTLGE